MQKYMVADLVKEAELYPKSISFDMTASGGSWKATIGINAPKDKKGGKAKVRATLKNNDIYTVTVTFPIYGSYKYEMPYKVVREWEDNADSGTWYNTKIKGNTAYFPK
jgi:hypothetical protein